MATLTVPAEPLAGSSEPASVPSPSSSTSGSPTMLPTSASASGSGDSVKKTKSSSRQKHRIVAACCGAIVTSLTMTPFDVIKTRLQIQSQPESLFIPSSHLPPPTQSAASTSSQPKIAPLATKAKGKGKASTGPFAGPRSAPAASATGGSSAAALQHARSLAATNLATCCQKTYFTTNLAQGSDILCRFDPRDVSSSSPSTSSSSQQVRPPSQGLRSIPIPSLSGTSSIIGSLPSGGSGSATLVLDASAACLYPSPIAARQHLPELTHPSARHFAGFFDAISKIVQHEGVSTLWRGLSASLVMSVPSQVIYMVGYDYLRTSALDKTPARFINPDTNQASKPYVASTTFVAGSVSRTAVASLLAPLELFRTRLQSTGSHVTAMSVTNSVRDLVAAQGVSSLWRGLSATLWRDVPFSGAYWAGYEGIRRYLSKGKGMGEIDHSDAASKTFGIAFASGAGSGMIASFLTHPFDVIKTRRQTEGSDAQSRSTLRILKEIAERESAAGLWRGITPRVAKVAPACGIMIGAYEIGLRWTGE